MPVYLATIHAYRSWSEDHPKGYVLKKVGLKESDQLIAKLRSGQAKHDPVRFSLHEQGIIHEVTQLITTEKSLDLHAIATCPTHAHVLIALRSPHAHVGAQNTVTRNVLRATLSRRT